jgi:hypothetical protein
MAKLIIEGQTHTVPDELVRNGSSVAEQDENLRQALRPNFDLAANATFQRVEKDGELIVTVIKAPGRKGSRTDAGYRRVVQRLLDAEGEMTPMMLLACEMQVMEARGQLDRDALIALRPRIESVLEEGRRDLQRVTTARQALFAAPVVASAVIPTGF